MHSKTTKMIKNTSFSLKLGKDITIMLGLMGEYQHNIDKKGRMFVPSKLRDALGGPVVISKSIDFKPCLFIYSAEEWDKLVSKINNQPFIKVSALQRHLFSGATEVEYDAQGRVLLPAVLREYAGLKESEQAIIIGASNRVEIWSPDEWEKVSTAITPENIEQALLECEI